MFGRNDGYKQVNGLGSFVDAVTYRLNELEKRIEALEADSHPPQPVVTAAEFDEWTDFMIKQIHENHLTG